MEEVDALSGSLLDVIQSISNRYGIGIAGFNAERRAKDVIDLTRRAIVLHTFGKRRVDKVEELIRWMVKHWDWIGKLEGIAEGCVVEPWRDNARHILEIVEGK